MKKIIIYILLISHLFFSGKFGVFFHTYNSSVNAASTNWDFSNAADYTLSSASLTVRDNIGDLNLTVVQTGSLANDGATVFLDRAMRVHVVGNYAYVSAQNQDRVQVIDISDPTNPTAETNLQNNGTTLMLDGPRDFISSGNYLFVSENVGDAIQTIDISDPTNPIAAGNYANDGSVRLNGPRGMDIQGNYLYIASYNDDALQIFDISTPTTLVPVANLRDTARLNGARDVIVDGNYAYVSSRNDDSIQVIDISTPSSPSFAAEITDGGAITLDSVFGIDKQGDYIYATAYLQDAIQVIDVSSPTAPTGVISIGTTEMPNLDGPRDVVADGDFLFVADYIGDSITVLDISDPTNPQFEYELQESGTTNINGPRDLQRVGNFLHASVFVDDDFVTFETKYDTSSPFITPNTAFNYTGEELSSFSETLGAENEGNITYQISKDNGITWYYWNGSSWQTTINGVVDSNSAADINSNFSSFNAVAGGTDQFTWRAYLNSNGSQKVEIDDITVVSVEPGPGGVGSNLQIWLKGDAGTSTTTDGATLSTWNDQSGNGFNATAVTAPVYRNNSTDSLNFNPVIDFNGTTQYMENLNDGAYTQSYFMVIIPDNTIDGTVTGQVPVGFDCNSGTLSSGTCGLTFAGTVLGSFTVALPDEVITHALGSSANWRAAQNGVASYSSGKPMLVVMNENAGATNTDIYEKGVKVDSVTTNTYQSLGDADYTLGRSPDATYPFYYDGKIAEVINYSTRLSDSDRNKIEAYLSLKYGITLNNGTQDYLASDGSTSIWSTTTAGSYTSNIFGIGRDDVTELSQVQSKSVNDGAIITLEALGEGTNQSPSFVDMSDKEFLSISHENGSNAWSATDAPATYNILARKWKAQETGDVGTLQLDFDVADGNFDVPTLNAGTNYYFIYDTDIDGSLNDETPLSMTNISGDTWRISGINLSHNQTFTLATEAGSNNIPTDINISSTSINENVADGSTVGTLSTVDADIGDSHTYSLVSGTGDDDNNSFTIVGNALNINYSPDYEIKDSYSVRIQTDDGNGGTYQETMTININNLVETPTTIIDFEDISDEEKYTVTSGSWSRTTTNPQEGSRSLESDNGGANNTQSCFEVTHNMAAAGSIEFQYNVSSQGGSDFLHFYIDDVEQQTWSGTVPWTLYSTGTLATGVHDYKWCYIKDGGGSAGTDNAFIDYITFPSITEPILAVTKTDNDTDNTVLTEQIVRYTITLDNTGIDASGITITDAIDTDYGSPYNFTYDSCGSPSESFTAPTLTFSSVSVTGGNSCIITYDLQVDTGASSGNTIDNSADASAAVEGGNNPAAVNADTLTVLSCTNNNVSLVFETDGFGEDTFWSLTPTGNACGVGEIANGGNPNLTCASGGAQGANAADPYADNSTITEGPYSLTVGNQYDLHVVDDWGDGITAADPDVRIQQNGGDTNTFNMTGANGTFTFTVQEPTGCTDTISPSVTVNQGASQSDPTGADSATFKVAFDEPINVGTFTVGDITLAGTTGTVTSGPTEVAPNNGTSFEFTVTGMTLGDTVTATIGSGLIEDTSGNTNNASTSIDNQVTYQNIDANPPNITAINYASGSLLPGGNHNVVISYNDAESGIDTSSDTITLQKWNGVSWGSDISATGFDLGSKTITTTTATYPTNDLNFGKYRYNFSITDNNTNTSSTGAVFYIDEPEFIVGTGSIDIGNVDNFTENFSDTVTITVRTVGAAFDVTMNRTSNFTEGGEDIPSWDGDNGYGYDQSPFTGSISPIGTDENIATQAASINVDGNKNTYTYDIQIGALVEEFRTAGDYIGDLDFSINLTY